MVNRNSNSNSNKRGLLSWTLRGGLILSITLLLAGYFALPGLAWLGIIVLILTPLLTVGVLCLIYLSEGEVPLFLMALYIVAVLVISSLLRF